MVDVSEANEPAVDASGGNADETLGRYSMPTFVFPEGVSKADSEHVQNISVGLWAAIQALLEQRILEVPSLTVLVTDDIMGSADVEGIRIGIGPDHRSGTERVGGVVAAKTLLSDDSSEAVVLLNRTELGTNDGFTQLRTAICIAHEFGHALYGVVRNATVGISPDCWIPWEMAELMAVAAAEEYRCDRLAMLLVDEAFKPTDDHGERVVLADALRGPYEASLAEALIAISPGLEDAVLRYRIYQIPLQQMWNEIARISAEALLCVAHAEAHSGRDQSLLSTINHRGASLLRPITSPLHEYLTTTPLLPANDAWAEDRATLKRIGRDGLMAMWARLGLHPGPQNGGFYLQVTAPNTLNP